MCPTPIGMETQEDPWSILTRGLAVGDTGIEPVPARKLGPSTKARADNDIGALRQGIMQGTRKGAGKPAPSVPEWALAGCYVARMLHGEEATMAEAQ